MSSLPKGLDILAQLQVKKAPVQREEVAIIVRRPAEAAPVKIRTKVVDKTREGFDRDAFVSKIKDFLVVGTGRPREHLLLLSKNNCQQMSRSRRMM
jgi:hypothetical protein